MVSYLWLFYCCTNLILDWFLTLLDFCCCRFWHELLLALEQIYRLRAVCAGVHCCCWIYHLFIPRLCALCRDTGLSSSIHRGYAWCSSAVPKSSEQLNRRHEVSVMVLGCPFRCIIPLLEQQPIYVDRFRPVNRGEVTGGSQSSRSSTSRWEDMSLGLLSPELSVQEAEASPLTACLLLQGRECLCHLGFARAGSVSPPSVPCADLLHAARGGLVGSVH